MTGRCPAHPDANHEEKALPCDDRFWGIDGDFVYSRCQTCGALALDPPPPPDEIGRFYELYYPPDRMDGLKRLLKRKDRLGFLRMRKPAALWDLLEKHTPELADAPRVLDVGCGLGHFLAGARQLGAKEARGVDFSPMCAAFAKDVYDLDVDEGELAGQEYEEGQFDVVTAWHCLEHVYDPVAELSEMRRVVRPGGAVFIEVPTLTMFSSLFGRYWAALQAPTHLWHFRPDTLRRVCEEAGLAPVAIERAWHPGEIGASFVQIFVKGLMPNVVRRRSLWFWLLALLMLVDTPITMVVAMLGGGGILRVLAKRPE